MSADVPRGWRAFPGAPLFSPKGFLVRAALIGIVYLVCHAAGLREHTAFLSGTDATAGAWRAGSAILGAIYLLSYFAFVLAAPVLVLAAGLLRFLLRLFAGATPARKDDL